MTENNQDTPGTGTVSVTEDGPNSHSDGAVQSCVYSGADIKLVVHMPPLEDTEENIELRQLEGELAEVQRQLQSNGAPDSTVTQAILRSSEITDEIADEVNTLNNLAVIWGDTPQEDIDTAAARVSILEGERSELQEIINQASWDGSLAELRETERTITEQIQELRDGGANGTLVVTKTLAEITTLSVSTHREKNAVRTLGSVYPRSYTRGPRSISGSMVFTTFYQHVFSEFFESLELRSTGARDFDRFRWTTAITDQLPPLDISISFANEYGNISWMSILGVEFVNEGMVMSIEDLFIEGTVQYVARDYDPIRNVGNRSLRRNHGVGRALSGSNLLFEDLNNRVRNRRNPFL